MSGTTINITGNSNDTNLVLGSANASISDSGSVPAAPTPDVSNSVTLPTFTIGTSWSIGFAGLGDNASRFINDLSLVFKDLYNISIVENAANNYTNTGSDASYQGYIGADYYLMGLNPAYLFFTAAPFGMTSREYITWIKYGGGQELWDELHSEYNIKPFAIGTTGFQGGIYSNKEINTKNDISGLKIRIKGVGAEIFRSAGADPKGTDGGEIANELSNNQLDAAEFISIWHDTMQGIPKHTKYHYPFSFHEPGNFFTFGINKTDYDKLSSDKKIHLQTIADSNLLDCISLFEHQNSVNLANLYQDVSAREFSPEIKTLLKEKTKSYYEKTMNDLSGNKKDIYERIIDSYFTYLNRQNNWSAIQNSYSLDRDISLSLPYNV